MSQRFLPFFPLFVCLFRGFYHCYFFLFQVRSDFSIFEGFFFLVDFKQFSRSTYFFLCVELAKQRKEKPKPKVLTIAFTVRINYGFSILHI